MNEQRVRQTNRQREGGEREKERERNVTQPVSRVSFSRRCLAKRKNRQQKKTHAHDVYSCVCMSLPSRLASFSNMNRIRCGGRIYIRSFALLCVCVCMFALAAYVMMSNGDCRQQQNV